MLPTSSLLTSDRLALQQCAVVRVWLVAAQDAMECAQSCRLSPECLRRISGMAGAWHRDQCGCAYGQTALMIYHLKEATSVYQASLAVSQSRQQPC